MSDSGKWNYQQMTGEDCMSPSNPGGHPMIVPQSTPTRQPVELPIERPAMIPRAELEAVERERDEARRDAVEAIDARNVAIAEKALAEAEASERLAKAREQLDRIADAITAWDEPLQGERCAKCLLWGEVLAAIAAVKGGKP